MSQNYSIFIFCSNHKNTATVPNKGRLLSIQAKPKNKINVFVAADILFYRISCFSIKQIECLCIVLDVFKVNAQSDKQNRITMANIDLSAKERIDDLQFKGLKIIQHEEHFCFGLDAVLLARFSFPKDSDKIIDLGTGTGIIPLMASGLCSSDTIVGIDIQECMCELASKSVSLNELCNRISILNCDLRQIQSMFEAGSFSLAISNPPYIKAGSGIVNDFSQKAISRHEIMCCLDDVACAAGYLLKEKGRFALVNKPERIAECFDAMRKYSIEPKRVQLVYPKADKPPSAVLIEGVKGANAGLRFMRPIIVMNESGEYTCQIESIYSDKGEDIFR